MKDYKKFSLELAKIAAKQIKKDFKLGMTKTDKAEDGSPLTETDVRINQLVIDAVRKNYPGHSVLGEEKSDVIKDSEFAWACDPIDGTIPFSHGIPLSTFTLALIQNGKPILGVIADPFGENTYFAEKNKGAYLNDKKITVSKKDTLTSSMVFSEYWKQAPYPSLKIIEALETLNCHVPIFKSIALGCGLVAAGEAVGVIFPGKTPWDIAAAKIIIEEAGGKTSDFFGNSQRYDQEIKGFIASNGILHKQLVDIVKKTSSNLPAKK